METYQYLNTEIGRFDLIKYFRKFDRLSYKEAKEKADQIIIFANDVKSAFGLFPE